MNERPLRLAFLVGAGLVADAGLPTAPTLTAKLKAYLGERTADGDAEAKRLLSIYNFIVGGIRFQRGILDLDPDEPIDIEQLAGALSLLQTRSQSPLAPYVSGWHQRLSELERDQPHLLQRLSDVVYQRLEHWLTVSSPDQIKYISRLARFVQPETGLDIFSLNYDMCIERAITDFTSNGIVNGFSESGWRPDSYAAEGIRLFKLHGSLDWVDDEVYGICSLEHPPHAESADLEGSAPLLIFGTDAKVTGRDPFLTLLYQFSVRMDRADVLVVIGYGFGDRYLNEVLEQRMRSNPRLRLIAVSPTVERDLTNAPTLIDHPRVATEPRSARTVLEKGILLRQVNRLLRVAADEEPF